MSFMHFMVVAHVRAYTKALTRYLGISTDPKSGASANFATLAWLLASCHHRKRQSLSWTVFGSASPLTCYAGRHHLPIRAFKLAATSCKESPSTSTNKQGDRYEDKKLTV